MKKVETTQIDIQTLNYLITKNMKTNMLLDSLFNSAKLQTNNSDNLIFNNDELNNSIKVLFMDRYNIELNNLKGLNMYEIQLTTEEIENKASYNNVYHNIINEIKEKSYDYIFEMGEYIGEERETRKIINTEAVLNIIKKYLG